MKLTLKHQSRLVLLAIVALLPQLVYSSEDFEYEYEDYENNYDFMVDGVCYKIDSNGTNVIIIPKNVTKEIVYDYGEIYTINYYYSGGDVSGALNIPTSVIYNGTTYLVTSIAAGAFRKCSGLTSVTIPNSVTSIGDETFAYCSSLTSVTIPNSVTSIGEFAFRNCGLTEVEIPSSVASIGGGAFYNCPLVSVVWNAKNCVISTSSENEDYEGASASHCYSFDYTYFLFCRDMNISYTYLHEPDEFYEGSNNNIKTFIIGEDVEAIPAYLCKGLNGLTSVIIPNSVTSIGNKAFYGCSGLTSVYSKIKNPQTVDYDDDIFSNCPLSQCPLYVPHGKHDVYSTTSPWSAFSNIIEMDPTGDVNDDGTVNVTDYVATARYILELNPQPFYLEECDFNENGIISVGDLVGVASLALSFEGAPMLSPGVGVTENPVLAMAADVDGRDGSYEVSVNLSNNVDLTALQMDLDLPAGMTLVDASLSDRASGSHQVAFNQLSNGDYRLLASSPACKSFTGSEGAVLTLTLAGEPSGDGLIRNIELATPRAASYKVDDIELHFTSTTGVENMTSATAARIYSDGSNIVIDSPVDGKAMIVLPNGMNQTVTVTAGSNVFAAPANGIIIVKMGDSTKKLYIK